MSPVGPKIYRATKGFPCSHCGMRIRVGADYLRFYEGLGRRPVCILDAISAYNVNTGKRVYECEAIEQYVLEQRALFTDDELVYALEGGVMAAAIVADGHHPAVDFLRGFAQALRRNKLSK